MPHLPNRRRWIHPLGRYDLALVLMLWSFTHAGEARAGNAESDLPGFDEPDVDLPRAPSRFSLAAPTSPMPPPQTFDTQLPKDEPTAFPTEFRPHGPSIAGTDRRDPLSDETPHGSVWQRLGDFRTHNRLRLLTLWQTGGNSLSLQAGRKGDPTLQWTSRLSHRAESGGLLDELFSTSPVGAIGKELHLLPHFQIESAAKPAKSSGAPLSASASGH